MFLLGNIDLSLIFPMVCLPRNNTIFQCNVFWISYLFIFNGRDQNQWQWNMKYLTNIKNHIYLSLKCSTCHPLILTKANLHHNIYDVEHMHISVFLWVNLLLHCTPKQQYKLFLCKKFFLSKRRCLMVRVANLDTKWINICWMHFHQTHTHCVPIVSISHSLICMEQLKNFESTCLL